MIKRQGVGFRLLLGKVIHYQFQTSPFCNMKCHIE